ncbi:PTS system IIA component, Glc family [Granulicatella balaenopterae]|uniref:PTS system IIA component, Glc family n=1 Tax=Granulicatella balaenopterae TaxID=137733 RepID=A0A1H9H6P5_9LACT|nr:PTS glucose transporter subunit IIA [Granulicatella balaenopterae]SEQ58031.1 PTS system IIA component, Glc family [Granulicatella balaenopterae]
MFGFFKKKKEQKVEEKSGLTLYAVANGEVIPIDQVDDAVFSQKFMGDGYAVLPTDGNITSPCEGEVLNVFPTQHAVGIKTDDGVEILLHMGLDTVELNGEPFETVVKEGQRVTKDTVISTVDLAAIEAAGKKTPMIVALTNMDKIANVTINPGQVSATDVIGHAELNA